MPISSATRALCLVTTLGLLTLPAGAATTYTYDELGRIVTVTYDNGKQIYYQYDAAGNRTEVAIQDGSANWPPIAVADSITTTIAYAHNFDPRANDSDPDSDPLTITAKTDPDHGTVVIESGTSLTYTPVAGYWGEDAFTYTISDGQGHSASAVVSVTVENNHTPVAVDDSISAASGSPKTFDPRTNDSDADNDPLTIIAKTDGAHGSVVINAGTSLTYTSETGYTGGDSFTYTISDGLGHSAVGTVSVTVTANLPPIANDDSITTNMDTAKNFDPRVNDSDPESDPLTISAKTDGTHGIVTINSGTSLTYTPNTSYTGADSFTYTITDGQGNYDTANVTVSVIGNQPPDAVNDSLFVYGVAPVQPSGSLDPRYNDSDPNGDPLTIIAKTNGTKGTVTITGGGTGLTYQYNTMVNGPLETTDSFTYTISDGNGGTDTATVNVDILVTDLN